ncbi:MAG: hypothetical protein KDJ65_27610 [Anaerolineae bacterium]|nr:hypothetical protein [Anaerolineae bacterium]
MGKFLEAEKPIQTKFKYESPYFSTSARKDGVYKRKPRAFCIPRENAEENLFQGIRQAALAYFEQQGIKWHDGQDRKPSNHLCDSQVCCVNFLFAFANQPEALVELLHPVFPNIAQVMPMETEGQFVSFEWIGAENYLREKVGKNRKRTRGANFTSTDAAVMFEDKAGMRQIVLIEWKYTESYSRASYKISKRGTDRTIIYAPLYNAEGCPLDKSLLSDFGDLFYEPFYQLMRQQFLAREMEKWQELGAQKVSVLHIAPDRNTDFQKITSPALQEDGKTATEKWKELVRYKDRFASVNTENLFGRFPVERYPDMQEWWEYLRQRYSFLA